MKKENKFLELLNSKGFYTALFTCLFAILAIAAFVSIRNIDAISRLSTYGEKDQAEQGDYLLPAGSQHDKPISELEAAITENRSSESVKKTESGQQAKPQAPQTAPQTQVRKIDPSPAETNKPDTKTPGGNAEQQIEGAGKKSGTEVKTEEKQESKAESKSEEPAQKQENKEEAKSTPDNNQQKKTEEKSTSQVTALEDGEDMSWPLDGAIAMGFSTKHAIYDKTLDQFRTNPTVSISADVGTQVKAAAGGVVKSISISPREGYTVVLDHGDGWQTVYGQLQETILVKEGDTVKNGQAIGGVGEPTKYGILLGSHLIFGINKDDVPQDPVYVLSVEE